MTETIVGMVCGSVGFVLGLLFATAAWRRKYGVALAGWGRAIEEWHLDLTGEKSDPLSRAHASFWQPKEMNRC